MARLQVGDYRYLKNFRKCFKQQREHGLAEHAEATRVGDAATASDHIDRLIWIQHKQASLDTGHEMIKDGPVTKGGGVIPYGSLEPKFRRRLTDREVHWNAQMITEQGGCASNVRNATSSCNSSSWRR